ncbi:MAG: hypothetical protein CL536_04330 [Alcaligenaceae bacterium]|nr:hypothetical protein [Alcaligenaceae bacterium]
MPLPTFHCPACRNPLTAEVVLANEAVRECIVLLMDAHPSASGLLRPLLAYLGLFAPAKQAIRYERMAGILEQLVPMIRSAQVQRNGRTWSAPVDYWRQGLEEVVARGHQGALKLPLKSHGYLLEVVSQLASKDDSKRETALERQRAGVSGTGTAPARVNHPVSSTPKPVREAMPDHVREQLFSTVKKGGV